MVPISTTLTPRFQRAVNTSIDSRAAEKTSLEKVKLAGRDDVDDGYEPLINLVLHLSIL